MARKQRGATKWIDIFLLFVKALRINSKEENSEDENGVPFDLWSSQIRFLEELADGLEQGIREFCILKSRQLGITTICLAIDVFWMAMYSGTSGAIVTDSEDNREAARRQLRQIINSVPEGYFGADFKITSDNRNAMTFSNGSSLVFLVAGKTQTKKNWGEGKGFSFVHMTERSKYGSAEGISNFEESFAQANPDRLFISESTANGFNHFRDYWLACKKDETRKKAFFIGWWAAKENRIPKGDPLWLKYCQQAPDAEERELIKMVYDQYRHKITPEQLGWYRYREAAATGETVLDQNQPWVESQAFILSGFSFFQIRKIQNDMERLQVGGDDQANYQAYRFYTDNDFFTLRMVRIVYSKQAEIDRGEITAKEADECMSFVEDGLNMESVQLRVWEPPQPNGVYVIGIDPSWGQTAHGDRHCISVWRCFADKLMQVAEFASNEMDWKRFAWICLVIAGSYEDCIVNIELDGPGRTIMPEWDHLRAMLRAEHIAPYAAATKKWGWEDALNNARWYLYHRPDTMGSGYAYNSDSNSRTVGEMMHGFRGAYSTDQLVVKSIPMLEEMKNVVQDGDSIGAPESDSPDGKDDRVFAAGLAYKAWIDWARKRMMGEGRMYDNEMARETGTMPAPVERLNDIWFKFFQRARALEDEFPDNRPEWKVQRGLA